MSLDVADLPPDLQREHAEAAARAAVVAGVRERMEAGRSKLDAIHAAAVAAGRSESSVRRWLQRTDEAETQGVSAVQALTDRPRSGRPPAAWSPDAETAWMIFRSLRERPENPTSTSCWRLVAEIAALQGWAGVPKEKEFHRRWAKVGLIERVLATEGRIAALHDLLPHQTRTVAGLRPLDWVNGDGYDHHLFVTPPDGGDPIRPCTWAWQDVRTRKILAYRSGLTETAELLRLSFHDLVTEHGTPRHALMDNTRAASAKSFAGASRRWRSDGEDPPGVIRSLGVIPHRTTVDRTATGKGRGRGRSKPVERSFLDWGEEVDKHPFAAGAYVGRDVFSKPENYGSRALEWEEFLAIVDDGIRRLNARPGRRTEACGGRLSFDQAWAEEFAAVQPRRLPAERTAILLLAVESTKVKRSGVFTLQAGSAPGQPRNQYHHSDLVRVAEDARRAARAGRPIEARIVARFDPDDLHAGVHVFDFAGKWLCYAECHLPVGFADAEGAKKYARLHRSRLRLTEQERQAGENIADLLERYGVAPPAKPLPPNVVRMPTARKPDDAKRREVEERLARGLKQTVNQ